MPFYVVLSTLTDDGLQTLKKNPGRINEVNREIEDMGVRLVAQYGLLGPYDFVTVLEAPSNETVARLMVELGSRGTIRPLSMPAIPVEQFIHTLSD